MRMVLQGVHADSFNDDGTVSLRVHDMLQAIRAVRGELDAGRMPGSCDESMAREILALDMSDLKVSLSPQPNGLVILEVA